jgi:homoserine/homoserine lactone efflux protein
MDSAAFLAFVAATAVMIALPGPSVMLTVAHGISYGWRRALITVAGATAGIAVQLAVAALGLSALLRGVASALEWVRWLGVAYLGYLGAAACARAVAAPRAEADAGAEVPEKDAKGLFAQGLAVTVPNPKSLVFIAAFLPQFMDAERPLAEQFAVIVPTFLAVTFAVTSMWALAAGKARRFLRSARAARAASAASGVLMLAAGAALALARLGS